MPWLETYMPPHCRSILILHSEPKCNPQMGNIYRNTSPSSSNRLHNILTTKEMTSTTAMSIWNALNTYHLRSPECQSSSNTTANSKTIFRRFKTSYRNKLALPQLIIHSARNNPLQQHKPRYTTSCPFLLVGTSIK